MSSGYEAVIDKLNKEFRLLSKFVKPLNKSNGELMSTINDDYGDLPSYKCGHPLKLILP